MRLLEKVVKIIVRDDGSSDGTRQILRNYAQTYSNIQLLFEDNCGGFEKEILENIQKTDKG